MLLARPLASGWPSELELAGRRLGLGGEEIAALPGSAALPLLLTGLLEADLRFLSGACRAPGLGLWTGTADDAALLCGPRPQLLALAGAARSSAREALALALTRALEAHQPPAGIELGGVRFFFGSRSYLMGVVNVTPDSFSDGGRFLEASEAIAQGERLAAAGADLLDIGGESTRPGAKPVSADEELSRVLPVIAGLKARTGVPISVDTTKAAVAKEALAGGASFVNDISGLTFDAGLPRVVAEAGAACCVMHIQGTPESMQAGPRYQDLMAEILESLTAGVERAVAAGVRRERIFVDPGIGFGKSAAHNWFILRRLAELRVLGQPVLVGPSRKAFLGQVLGGRPPAQRAVATAAVAAIVAAGGGADVVRVHDVTEVRDALRVAEAIKVASDGGTRFAPAL